MSKRLSRWIVLSFLTLFIVGMGVNTVYRSGPYVFGGGTWGSKSHRCDFTVYLAAGAAVLQGTDIYQARNVRGWSFVQPPLFAVAMAPFAMIPQIWAVSLWYLINVLATIFSVRMCAAMLARSDLPPSARMLLHWLPPLLIVWLLTSAAAHGQSSIVMLWLTISALYASDRGHEILGGASLACAALIKVFPILLLVYFLWRRRWLFVAASLLSLAIGLYAAPSLVFGWQGNQAYVREWTQRVAAPAMSSENDKSAAALYATLLDADMSNNQGLPAVAWRWSRREGSKLAARLTVALMALAVVWVGRRRRLPEQEPLLLGALIVCAALIPPVSWSHYFVALLYPLTALTAHAQRLREAEARRRIHFGLALYALFFLAASSEAMRRYGALCVGAIILWGVLIYAARRVELDAGESPQTAFAV